MLPREVKEIDWKQYIEYEAFQEMRDMKSKIDGERIDLLQENKRLKQLIKDFINNFEISNNNDEALGTVKRTLTKED